MAGNLSYSVVFSSRAQKEVVQSWEWYEDRQQGLGDRFIQEIGRQIKLIEENPDRWATRFSFYKEALVSVFPFMIIYKINKRKKSVRVVSVFHTALNPKRKY